MRPQPQDSIRIRGARVHNLKNVSIDLPHNQLVVVTGVSGSGKSSLVFDTIYAEGQRRYVESLSAYARQFLERIEKPDLDEADGIAPPIAIRQKNTTRNPRSTVATSTEIYDYLRVLFARAGRVYCPACGQRVERDTVDQVAARMLNEPEGSRWLALFTVHKPEAGREVVRKPLATGAIRDHLFEIRKKGFNRLYQSGRTFEFSTPESLLEVDFTQPVYALVDRLVIRPGLHSRLADTVEVCYREAGEVIFEEAGTEPVRRLRFSERFACKRCDIEYPPPEPVLFSFNSPAGACPRCQGFGRIIGYDMQLVAPDGARSIAGGAIDPWNKPTYEWWLEEFLRKHGKEVRCEAPFATLTNQEKAVVRAALDEFFAYLETKKYKVHVRVFLNRYRGYEECPDCGGARLRPEARNVFLQGKSIADIVRMNIAEALEFFQSLTLLEWEEAVAGTVLEEIRQRLRFLVEVGLDYLTLDRLSMTLSGGEAQRIQLATCLGSRLVGAIYVLDEPSIGLHCRDTGRLIRILQELRDLGNTVLVVEHDADVIRAANHIVDMGPGAGERGGEVVFQGNLSQLLDPASCPPESLTGRYLRGETRTFQFGYRRTPDPKRQVHFYGCRANNLKGIDIAIPLDVMTVVTGVSGSGKSTLVHEVIHRNLSRMLSSLGPGPSSEEPDEEPGRLLKMTCSRVVNADLVRGVVLVDQSPIGRTPRSNPVTYIKAFDIIRDLLASTPEAQRRGYLSGYFSFNVPGGRCEACQGEGTVTVEMQFLADVELVCEECQGTRFKSSVLDIRYRGLNVHEILQLTVREALAFFSGVPRLVNRLKILDEVGLGYLRLGQSATTLSGGEAQRVKLAAHLMQPYSQGILYIFDEPTTGLHFDDIAKLLNAFRRLLDNGATLLVIEHNLEVICAADWIIDLGPEGGAGGGEIVACGTPESVAASSKGHTARYLKAALDNRAEAHPPDPAKRRSYKT